MELLLLILMTPKQIYSTEDHYYPAPIVIEGESGGNGAASMKYLESL